MCRLVGLRAARPVPLYRHLVAGDNSFAVQSLEHPDGWGLAYFAGDEPTVVKSVLPAICDELFETTALEAASATVLAHVRRATVGRVARHNCHPFRVGRWVFAHNGDVRGFDGARAGLVERIAPALRQPLEGQTDSEVFFRLFLTGLLARDALDDRRPSDDALRGALGDAVATIHAAAAVDGPTWLTCLATNGDVMVGLCGGKPLAVRAELDGDPLVAFSSEAIGGPSGCDGWRPLEHDELVVVGPDLALTHARL
jgi:glutamine amidotransferase